MKPGPLCDQCPLKEVPGPVWGEGSPSARLVIIGRDPGETEIQQRRPFVGGSGTVLNMALSSEGGSRDRSFLTNVVKCFVPPGSPTPPKAIECCRPLLQQEFNHLTGVKAIITLGVEAFGALTGKRLVMRHNRKAHEKDPHVWLRGCVYQKDGGIPIIPAPHPAFIMRTGFQASDEFRVDIRRGIEFASGIRSLPMEHLLENPSDGEVTEYVNELIGMGEGGLDIETPELGVDDDDLDPTVALPINEIGLSARVGESILIRADQFHLVKPLLGGDHSKVTLWAFNAPFDFSHLEDHFDLRSTRPACAMLAFYHLWTQLTVHDLATAHSLMVDMPYYKNWRKCNSSLYNTLGNCRDTYSALWIGQEAMRQMAARPIDMRPLFWDHTMAVVVPHLIQWARKGVRVDMEEAMRLELILRKQLHNTEEIWNKLLPTVDWASPKQLVTLFTQQGLKVPLKERVRADKTRYRSPCVDDDALELFITKNNSATAKLVQVLRGLSHGIEIVNRHDDEGWMHPRWKAHAQVGGRIQSSGDNIENHPEELPLFPSIRPRKMVVGDTPDCWILQADFSQLEFREYVWYCGAKNLKEMLDSGRYIYGELYEQLFNEPFFKPGGYSKKDKRDDIPAWKLLEAKTYPMGFVYGREPKDPRGHKLYEEFHRANPEVAAFHTRLFLEVSRSHFYQSVFGRMRRFPNPKGSRNEILSCPGQLTGVDILIENVLKPLADLRAFECEGVIPRIIFPVHDSCAISVHRAKVEELAEHVQRCMTKPIELMGGLVIPAGVKFGPSWD